MGFLSKRRDNQPPDQESTLEAADASQAEPGLDPGDLAAQEAVLPTAQESNSPVEATGQDPLALIAEDVQAETKAQANQDFGGLMDIFEEAAIEVDATLSTLEKSIEDEDAEELNLDLMELTAQWRERLG